MEGKERPNSNMRYNEPDDMIKVLAEYGYYPEKDENIHRFIDRCLWDLYVNKGYGFKKLAKLLPASYFVFNSHIHAMGAPVRKWGGDNNLKHGKYIGWHQKQKERELKRQQEAALKQYLGDD